MSEVTSAHLQNNVEMKELQRSNVALLWRKQKFWLKLVSPPTDDLFVNTLLMLEASEVSLKSQDIL